MHHDRYIKNVYTLGEINMAEINHIIHSWIPNSARAGICSVSSLEQDGMDTQRNTADGWQLWNQNLQNSSGPCQSCHDIVDGHKQNRCIMKHWSLKYKRATKPSEQSTSTRHIQVRNAVNIRHDRNILRASLAHRIR